MVQDYDEANIHEKIRDELQKRIRAGIMPEAVGRRHLAREIRILQKRRPSQGMWVLTDFGLCINPNADFNRKLRQPKGQIIKQLARYEKRGMAMENSKITPILFSLYDYMGGATTSQILSDLWFTTTQEFYNDMSSLRGKGENEKVKPGNKTLGYFRSVLNWPRMEPAVRLVRFEPSPIDFRDISSGYNTLGKVIRAAMAYGFEVSFAREGDDAYYYAIALPEKVGNILVYAPENPGHAHFAFLHVDKSPSERNALSGKVRLRDATKFPDVSELEKIVNDYGERWFRQRCAEARAYRQQLGLE